MSLVAYGSSDESETSDIEENIEETHQSPVSEVSKQHNPQTAAQALSIVEDKGPHISDEEDDFFTPQQDENEISTGLNLPPPKNQANNNKTDVISDDTRTYSQSNSFLLGLPAPKASTVTPGPGLPVADAEDVLEDMVKPKEAELAIRESLPKTKKKKTIKITAPSIADFDSDDEDEPVKKKPKPTKGKSGLFALLPEPKNALVKETGRLLVPHVLSKKPAPVAKPKVGITPKASISKADTNPGPILPGIPLDDDSDEDDRTTSTGNFFSLGANSSTSDSNEQIKVPLSASSFTVTSSSSVLPPVTRQKHTQPTLEDNHEDSSNPGVGIQEEHMVSEPVGLSDEPLQFKGNMKPSFSGYNQSHTMAGPSRYTGQEVDYESYPQYSNMDYNEDGQSAQFDPNAESGGIETVPATELIRLQGKRQFGKEAIDIIDFHADDHTNTMDLVKNMTEEVDMHSHSSKKKDQPSSQQKRKHQITYLAHKAKEREFELKNQWSQNRATQRQAQSKYGF